MADRRLASIRWRLGGLAAAAIIAVLGVTPIHAAAQSVTLANGEWAPFQGEKLPNGGVATQIATEAFESQGWSVSYKWLPWARGKAMAAKGKLDGTLIYSYTKEREQDFIFTDPIITLENRIFYNKDNPVDWDKPADLEGLTIGGVVDYDYDILRENDLDVTLQRASEAAANFRKLGAGRVDAVISNRLVGRGLAEDAGVSDTVEAHPKPTSEEPYHVMVSREAGNADAIVKAFNAGLAELKDSGRYAEILGID